MKTKMQKWWRRRLIRLVSCIDSLENRDYLFFMKVNPFFTVSAALVVAAPMVHAQQFTIRPGSQIDIELRGVPTEESSRVTGKYTVSGSGTIRLPLLGDLRASGLTSDLLARRIELAYKGAGIYRNPSVNVNSNSTETQQQVVVYMAGRVAKRGALPITPGMTVYQAIQNAGGPDEFGAMNRVELIRKGEPTRILNMKDGENLSVEVQQDDMIKIPEKNWLGQ